jgi:orotate phosphoribosyltransferase
MIIKNKKLIKDIANFKDLIILQPNESVIGLIPVQFNRSFFSDPKILKELALEVKRIINFKNIDLIAGIELSGVTFATSIALATGKPLVIVRSKAVRAGRSNIWGDTNFLKLGSRILLVDDNITGGETKKKAIKIIKSRKARVTDLIVFHNFKYQKTKRFNLKKERSFLSKKKIKLHPLLNWEELIDLRYREGTMDKDLREICLAMQKMYLFSDDRYGYITKTINLMKKYNLKLSNHFRDWLKEKEIKFKF